MGWAVTLEGRSDRRGIVVLIDDRAKAEHIAGEIRSHGTRVVVMPYAEPVTSPGGGGGAGGPMPHPASRPGAVACG